MMLAPKLTKYTDPGGLYKFFNGHPDQVGLANLMNDLHDWLGRNRRRGWFPVSTKQLEPYYPRGKGLLAMLADTGLIKLMMSENECLVYLDIEHVIYQDCWRAWSDGNVLLTKEEIRDRLMEGRS